MLVLDEDCFRGVRIEIQGLQDFVVISFGIDVKEMDLPHAISIERFFQWAHFDAACDDERFKHPVQVLHNVISVERPQLVVVARQLG